MKELNEEGFEVVDGRTVRVYEIKFSGSIILEPEDAASIASGDSVTCLVTGRVQPPKFSTVLKTGEMKRQNVIKLEALLPVEQEVAAFALDTMGVKVNGINDGIIDVPFVLSEKESELGFNPEDILLGGN
jgi:hypothetical protein